MSRYQDVNAVKTIGIVGTGTIGASWAAYFLAQGFKVKAWDPANTWKVKLENFIESVWKDLEKLGVPDISFKPDWVKDVNLQKLFVFCLWYC